MHAGRIHASLHIAIKILVVEQSNSDSVSEEAKIVGRNLGYFF
jgi:hypothetical protein